MIDPIALKALKEARGASGGNGNGGISESNGKPILTDRITGKRYELYVEDGKLTMQEIVEEVE